MPPGTVTALLVDDETLVLEGLRELLQATGVDVPHVALDAAEAQQKLQQHRPDVLITDLQLGRGPDGIQLTKGVRARYPKLPVLLLSGYDEGLFAEQALEAGASGFIMKDAPVEQLVEAVQCVVSGGMWVSRSVRDQLVALESANLPPLIGEPMLAEIRAGNRSAIGLSQALGLTLAQVEDTLARACRRLELASPVALYLLAAECPHRMLRDPL